MSIMKYAFEENVPVLNDWPFQNLGRCHVRSMLCQLRIQAASSYPMYHYAGMSTNVPLPTTMQDNEIGLDDLVKSLADNFNVLADEVQLLSDRKTILEHKLRFAHEQVR